METDSGVSLRLRLSILRAKARRLFYDALPCREEGGIREQGEGAALYAQAVPHAEAGLPAEASGSLRAKTGHVLAGAGILPALIFGDRSLVSPRLADLFAGAALSHSLALSGMHLAFAVLAGGACARFAGFCFPPLYLRLPRPTLTLLAALPFALIYLWLGQAPVSLQRAFCMLCAAALCSLLRRPRLILDSLCAALFVLMLWDPFALFDLSLQLSALCMVCIAVTLPGILRLSEQFFPAGKTGDGARALSPAVRLKRGAFVLAANSLCIQIVLMPLTLRAFGNAGLLFPLNLLWLPLLQSLVLPLSFAALTALCLDFSAVGAALLRLASLPCEGLAALLEHLDGAGLMPAPLLPRPHGVSMAAFWLLCLSLPRLLRLLPFGNGGTGQKTGQGFGQGTGIEVVGHGREQGAGLAPGRAGGCGQEPGHGMRRKSLSRMDVALPVCALACLVLPFVFLNRPAPGLTLSLLDVGQGQAVLLEWTAPPEAGEIAEGAASGRFPENGGRILVDGGGSNSEFFDPGRRIVAPLLTDNALPRLTAVVNSHPDADHLGGLPWIVRHFSVGRIFGNGQSPQGALAVRMRDALRAGGNPRTETLRAGDVYEPARDLRLEVLHPSSGAKGTSNDLSLVLRLLWRGKALALICGDVGREVLRELMREGRDLSAQVLVLPHHGSKGAFADGFYKAVAARTALVSCSFANVWGFPSRAVRDALRDLGIPLYTTAEHGMIRLHWSDPEAEPELSLLR
jgi:competence protein ComEC